MYLEFGSFQSIAALDSWDGMSPPTARTYKGKPVNVKLEDMIGKERHLPNFGPYAKEKRDLKTKASSQTKYKRPRKLMFKSYI